MRFTTRRPVRVLALASLVLAAGCADRTLVEPHRSGETPSAPIPHPAASVLPPTVDTYVVTNASASGGGSLAAALDSANADPDTDLIQFNIPGPGPHTIHPTSLLIAWEPVVIDGYSQPGSSPNTNGPQQGSNAVLKIEIKGDQLPGGRGPEFVAGGLIRGLAINEFDLAGVRGSGMTVVGNFIGTDLTGSLSLGNDNGVWAHTGATIGGPLPADRNVISGNNTYGIRVDAASPSGVVIQGNIIGLNAGGDAALGNTFNGISLQGGTDTKVGGDQPGEGNIISGNAAIGTVEALGVGSNHHNTVIQGNYIGTDVTGTTAIPNGALGIQVAMNNVGILIGGTSGGAGNLISGNTSFGVGTGGDNAMIQGNIFGLDKDGTAPIPGGGAIQVRPSDGVLIGGSAAGARNIISDSQSRILVVQGATSNVRIQGNYIGTDITGTVAIGGQIGVDVSGNGTLIGGSAPGEGNLISGIQGPGIFFRGGNGSVARGNVIGIAATGDPLGNRDDGINIWDVAQGITIGGLAPGDANVIANNGRAGIAVRSGSQGNTISANSIYDNTTIGIDLGLDGVTANDTVPDPDPGANQLQNFPVITAASAGGGNVLVVGTLDSEPSELYRLEFFANTAADPSGYGEGETFIGYADVPTDGSGLASFSESFPAPPGVAPGHYMTATATDAAGNTSEFSLAVLITDDITGPVTTNTTASPNPVAVGDPVTLTADVDDSSTGGADVVSAEYSLDGGATWAPMSATDGAFDSATEGVTVGFDAPATADIYDVCVRGTDAATNTGASECIMLVVYDPMGGFVTGSGWIDSPPGAYVDDPLLTGKATFGFVSKYQKGATTPSGNTAFRFQAAGLRFASTSYDWLVVNQGGTNAQFKGSGEINGGLAPNGTEFRFMVWAKDGNPDTLRIKIWWEDLGVETVVYDNGFNQPIGAGRIEVHAN